MVLPQLYNRDLTKDYPRSLVWGRGKRVQYQVPSRFSCMNKYEKKPECELNSASNTVSEPMTAMYRATYLQAT